MKWLSVLLALFASAAAEAGGWVTVPSGVAADLRGVDFAGGTGVAYAAGHSGTILKSADGGASWVQQVSGTAQHLLAVDFPVNGNVGYVVGAAGIILRTVNGGATWTPLVSGVTDILRAVQFIDDSTGYAAGDNGVILKTTDGGTSWILLPSGTTVALFAVSFPAGAQTGYVVGQGGTILKTTDGGTSFGSSPSGTTQSLFDVNFPLNATTGYASGASGTLLKTTDSGLTWTLSVSGVSSNLFGVRFADGATGYVVGVGGTIDRTIDSGFNWFRQPSPAAQDLVGVDFGSATTGVAVGTAGTIVRTTDGGDPWVALHPNQNGTISNFSGLVGCGAKVDCINDQTGNAAVGVPVANDGATSFILDADGATNRETFRLADGTVPASATIVAIEIRAAVGRGSGTGHQVALSYQRMGFDVLPLDGGSTSVATACCTTTAAWFLQGLAWTPAQLNSLEIGLHHTAGGELQSSQLFVVVTYQAPPLLVNYRSIGTALDYSSGTVSASNGSATIVGTGTSWIGFNRGRGDRMRIDGVDYTVLAVAANNVLTLTSPFTGASGAGKAYSLARQFPSIDSWEDCVDGNPCGSFAVASASLVSDNRSEVGIVYNDQVYTLAPNVVIDGSITDATHTITLTADRRNRHLGKSGMGVVLSGAAANAIQVQDEFVTIEWLEIGNGTSDGIRVPSLGLPHRVVLRNLLIHDMGGDGVEFSGVDLTADVFDTIVYKTTIGIRVSTALSAASRLRLVNNTIYSGSSRGVETLGSSPVVTLVNNIAASSPINFLVPSLDPSSDYNLSTDATAPGANSLKNVPLASIAFASTAPLAENLHVQMASVARNAGADMSGLFTIDVDNETRAAPWDMGADEIAAPPSLTLSSAVPQTFVVGQPPQTSAPITIAEDPSTPTISALKDIRLRIPAAFPMRWDPAATLLTVYGPASFRVASAVAAFEDSGRTVVLDVLSDFAAGDAVTIEGLGFHSFTAPAPQDFLGLEVEADGVASVSDDKTIDIFPDGVPTLSSGGDQMFLVGSAPVASAPFTISEGNAPLIRAGTDLRVRIPAGFNMRWNSSDTTASIAGFASSKVSAAVSYEDLDGTLVLDVLTDFAPGDFVTVSGLSFANFTGISPADELELEVDDLGSVIDVDDKRIFVDGSADVPIFTATAKDSEVELEWVFPGAGACDSVLIRRDVGSFPGPAEGVLIEDHPCAGLEGMPHSSIDNTASNGVLYSYSLYVDNGPGYTAGKFVKARPFATSLSPQWAYSTSATSMAPPGLRFAAGESYVYVVSNDGILHGLNGDATGGNWIPGFIPNDLGAPAQARPPVVSFLVGGSPAAAFLSSQDGAIHAIDATDGSTEWIQTISTMVQAAPAGHFSAFRAGATDLILAGTRNAAAANSVEALRFDTGLPQWSFVNNLAQGDGKEIGIISGSASIDYGNQRIYFASRTRPGSSATLWAIDFTPTLLWSAALGNIDGSPVSYNGRLYVGNNAGVVHAVDAASGVPQWSRPLGDGPVKGFVFPKFGSNVLFVSTNNRVWAIEDKIGSGDVVAGWPVLIASPSFPLHPPGSTYVLVGSGDGRLYQIDMASPSTPTSVVLGLGTAAVGAPTLDIVKSMIYVGTDAGIIYGVLYPIF